MSASLEEQLQELLYEQPRQKSLREEDAECERRSSDKVVSKTYERLLDGQIRLLRLLPGKGDGIVCCQLVIVNIDSNPVYEAISYAWGRSRAESQIKLNGKVCWKRQNLVECLNSLRDEYTTRDLWVDALCINQADTIEKSSQINLMPHIYRSAARTLIWLGRDEEFGPIDEISDDYPNVSQDGKASTRYKRSGALNLLSHFAQDEHVEFNRRFNLLAGQLHTISTFGWWSRVWVVQETLLSKSAHLVLGNFMLPWHTACQAAINIVRHLATCCSSLRTRSKKNVYEPTIRQYLSGCAQVILSFRLVPTGTRNTLLATLWLFRNRLASIKHDKIYGLLGLISSIQGRIEPDYGKSFEQACRLVVVEDIRMSGNLDALRGSGKNLTEFSSWSIDWSSLNYWAEERSRILSDLYSHGYCASGSTAPQINTNTEEEAIIEPLLQVVGHVFDTVTEKGHRLILGEDIYSGLSAEQSLLESVNWMRKHTNRDDYICGGSVSNAIWRTLLGDCLTSDHDSHGPSANIQSLDDDSGHPTTRRVKARDFFAFALWRLGEMKEVDILRGKHQSSSLNNNKYRNVPAIRTTRDSIIRATSGRCMFRTAQGYLGIGPESIRNGDSVAILLGGSTPFVLRRSFALPGDRQAWTLGGDCYVHGWMDGEMMRGQDTSKWGDLILV